jgi:hypothetical protein
MPVLSATQEAETGRVTVPGQPRQKFSETSSQPKNWIWWCTSVIPATTGGIGRRIRVQDGPGKNVRLYLKNK